jgi:hypothetical protein
MGHMGRNQFSLRAIFGATTVVGVVLAATIRWRLVIQVLPALPSAVMGACIGSVAGRLIGTDHIDATIGAILGAIVGVAIYFLLLPAVE